MTIYQLTFSCPDCGRGCDVRIVPHERVTITHPEPVCDPAGLWLGWLENGVRLYGRRGDAGELPAEAVKLDELPEEPSA